ncbi:MAG: hypothetical protein HC836_24405 [Richelia sp. RM2_1_2]|nr:hypothetical protein [Richelia sp. SM2_1_7]NJM23007.1 hypothetical protein [Richelia sp. SM1_7_0]NJN07270.1 hypothetical protein [Richelia sp. RM1_1_1]NJO61279.1 hypothetical protein [Richelia sp. RM2_1_2]
MPLTRNVDIYLGAVGAWVATFYQVIQVMRKYSTKQMIMKEWTFFKKIMTQVKILKLFLMMLVIYIYSENFFSYVLYKDISPAFDKLLSRHR